MTDSESPEIQRAALPAVANDQVGLKLKRKREELDFVKEGVECYTSISTNNSLDERGAFVFKDAVLGLHTRDLLEIEDIKLQQIKVKLLIEREHTKENLLMEREHTRENLLMEREHTRENLLMEREHASAMFELENKKRIAENANSREALEIEQQRQLVEKQKQVDARAHANEMMTAEHESLKTTLSIENDKRTARRDHAKEMLEIAKQEKIIKEQGLDVIEQWIPKDIPEIKRCDMTLGREYVSSLLCDKVKPWKIMANYTSLRYRLRKFHPKIQVIKRDSRVFFKNDDLPAIKTILFDKLVS
jgi:hypothetical protein